MHVVVDTEAKRRAIIRDGGPYYDKKRQMGRVLAREVPELGLEPGDRLDPSPGLPDVAAFSAAPLPMHVVFWRRHTIDRQCTDPVQRRNPIFSQRTGANPHSTLHIDVLHTWYLGVTLRYVSEVIWRVREAMPSHLSLEDRVQRLKCELFAWYDAQGIASNNRLGELTLKMLGRNREAKFKAAETGILIPWAVSPCRKYPSLSHSSAMLEAGQAYIDYMALLNSSPPFPTPAQCQALMACCVRHLHFIGLAGVAFTPKHHLFVHLTQRIPLQGNPMLYSTFIDEHLNATIARIVAAAHPLGVRQGLFLRVAVLPESARNSHFAAGRLA